MKLIYSHLKKFLPQLDIEPQRLRDDLTMIGHFANFYEKISDTDFFIDLDIKVNRGDALGYYGLARDLSVYYQIPLLTSENQTPIAAPGNQLPITVNSADVRRVQAVKISGISVKPSPQWLVDFLKIHGINSINNVVDLTNFAMMIYGIPNHAFDTAKTGDNLVWENNLEKYPNLVTLDGTRITLEPETLVISNSREPLCLSMIGGLNSGISDTTTETILEMATYNRTRVRRDSRRLKVATEAGSRLEKDLDSNLIPQAFNFLISLILENTGGKISSQIYDYYPVMETAPQIEFNPQNPSVFSGISISRDFALDALKRLGCRTDGSLITPPTIRKDIEQEEDLVEEVIRFFGYDKIPVNQPLTPKSVTDITPPILYLIEKLKDRLVALGYDEIRSWPLVQSPYDSDQKLPPVKTQNSINSEFTLLRQSLIQSLQLQIDQYNRYKLPGIQIFEIGKVFHHDPDSAKPYIEHYSLGFHHDNIKTLMTDLDTLKTEFAIPDSEINIAGSNIAIILDNLIKPTVYQPRDTKNHAYEITTQFITLDANITLDKEHDPGELIKKYQKIIGAGHLWQIVIVDHYLDEKSGLHRYTFRVSYFNIDDKTAKSIHLTAFNLLP